MNTDGWTRAVWEFPAPHCLATGMRQEVGKVVIICGEPFRFFASQQRPDDPAGASPSSTTTPGGWFRTVTKKTWNANMFHPEQYSRDARLVWELCEQAAAVPMPVMIQHPCEYFSMGPSALWGEIRREVLILLPDFDEDILKSDRNPDVPNYFLHNRDALRGLSVLARFHTVDDAHLFIRRDQPARTHDLIHRFVGSTSG